MKSLKSIINFAGRFSDSPGDQPLGSEKDEFEKNSFHIMAVAGGEVIGVGRLHSISAEIFQIRYMAVDEKYRNSGVGTAIIEAMEKQGDSLRCKENYSRCQRKCCRLLSKEGLSYNRTFSHPLWRD